MDGSLQNKNRLQGPEEKNAHEYRRRRMQAIPRVLICLENQTATSRAAGRLCIFAVYEGLHKVHRTVAYTDTRLSLIPNDLNTPPQN